MKNVYPIFLSKTDTVVLVEVPDLEILTEGKDLQDAINMARDAIGLMGIDMQDDGKELPSPYTKTYEIGDGDIVTLVDVDFAEYRRKVDNKAVKKNCTIPYWLSVEAEKAGVNYSRILQDALMKILGISSHSTNY